MLANVSPPSAARGVVLASPSKVYQFHWVRDAALTYRTIIRRLETATDPTEIARLRKLIEDYVELERGNQLAKTRGGLGEPKFRPDGTMFDLDWGRPQNDSPALRAVTMILYANHLRKSGDKSNYIARNLYNALDFKTGIKADLEYVAHHWKDPSFDLWEEVSGRHFYTRSVQHRALIEGADFADAMGDPLAAKFYREQANEIATSLEKHWDPQRKIIRATLDRVDGLSYKDSGLDSAVILGVLHGATSRSVFGAADERVLSTASELETAFAKLYPMNQQHPRAPAIGRYPEDRYDGYTTQGKGNPWVLLTNSFAEFYYRVATELERAGKIEVTATNAGFFQKLVPGIAPGTVLQKADPSFKTVIDAARGKGDDFLGVTCFHSRADGSNSEQMNRDTGFMQGVDELTWNYASYLNAVRAKETP